MLEMYFNKNDLIKRFCDGMKSGKGSNLYIEDNKLINYTTIIAFWDNGKLLLNSDYYSSTTSRNQNLIRKHASHYVEVTETEIYNIAYNRNIAA